MSIRPYPSTRIHTQWKDLTGKTSENLLNLKGLAYQIDLFLTENASGTGSEVRAVTSSDNGVTFDAGASDYDLKGHVTALLNGSQFSAITAAGAWMEVLVPVSTSAITWASGRLKFYPEIGALFADVALLYGSSSLQRRRTSSHRAAGRPNAMQLQFVNPVTSGRYRVIELI